MKGKGYVERCLWEYHENAAMLERLKWLLSTVHSIHGQGYELHTVGGASDPVGDAVNRVLILERKILRTEEKTKPVEKLQADIANGAHQDRYVREVLKMRYLEHMSVDAVRDELYISSSTYGRAKQKLLKIACKYFGIEPRV